MDHVMRSPFIAAGDGTSLYFKDWGRGRPVLFIAGASMTSDCWQYQMAPLAAAGLRCVAYDRRGHGRSSQPGHGYDYDTLADDLASVIEALDLRDLMLVGYSMGAGEVVRYLTRHGSERVTRAVLLNPTTPFPLRTEDNTEGAPAEAFEATRAACLQDFPRWCEDIADAFFGPGTSREMKNWVATLALQTSLLAMAACNHTFSETDFRAELPTVELPVLVVHGVDDPFTQLATTSRRTAALLPNCRLELYDGASHGLPFTHIDRFNADLLRFATANG